MEFEEVSKQVTYWRIFVYASMDKHTRNAQWQYLNQQKYKWQNLLFLGGDLNDIRDAQEKKGGKTRSQGTFRDF